jgi:hypothetical protein
MSRSACLLYVLLLAACGPRAAGPAEDASAFNGRWNISASTPGGADAWWLEVNGAGGGKVTGRFVGAPGGGMYEPDEMTVRDGELSFSFTRKYSLPNEELPWEQRPDRKAVYRARLVDGKLAGSFEVEGHPETRGEWSGVRAPVIADKDDGTWKEGEPVELFNGKDLAGWLPVTPGKEQGWVVEKGILLNRPPTTDLVSEAKFWNFKLHAEYRLHERSNSGIALRGRYEVQLAMDHGREPSMHGHGAIYSRIAPAVNATLPPGEWQTLDVTLIGRDVTVVLNGKTLIEKGVIDGLTAMGKDVNEDQPGPIGIQGDHTRVEIRKMTVTPLGRG